MRAEENIFFSNEGTRNEVRRRVVEKFFEEIPGTGSGNDQSKYIYYVENLANGGQVYLERPANLHNGFDFLINVSNETFLTAKGNAKHYPAHDHLFIDLKSKKDENPTKYTQLYEMIQLVYDCHEISKNIQLNFETGYSVEMLLKVIKWFFIEQDIRYWNYSGRAMFMSGVPTP